jgi:hypothetical protein
VGVSEEDPAVTWGADEAGTSDVQFTVGSAAVVDTDGVGVAVVDCDADSVGVADCDADSVGVAEFDPVSVCVCDGESVAPVVPVCWPDDPGSVGDVVPFGEFVA